MITIRIWHYQLLPYLPDAQFKGQLRELVAIMRDWRDKGKTNHLLINKAMDYPKAHLCWYFEFYRQEYEHRYSKKIADNIIQEFEDFKIPTTLNINLFQDWHNNTYLNICMWNLYEKHLAVGKSRITDEEWARLCEGYKKIAGKEWEG